MYLAQKRADYMQDALSKGLNGSHRAAPGVSKPKEGKGNKGDKKGRKDRSKTPGGDKKPKGDRDGSKGRGRSAGAEGGKGTSTSDLCYCFQKST